MMYICIPISWDYLRRERAVSKRIAASSMIGKGRAAVISRGDASQGLTRMGGTHFVRL